MFMRKVLTVQTELAPTQSGERGVTTMNIVEMAWVTTIALTSPILLARGGAARFATPMSMLEMPITGPLMESGIPWARLSHTVIRGTTIPAPNATIEPASVYLARVPLDLCGSMFPNVNLPVLRVLDSLTLSMRYVDDSAAKARMM